MRFTGKRKGTLEGIMVSYGELALRAIPGARRITLLDADRQPAWSSGGPIDTRDPEAGFVAKFQAPNFEPVSRALAPGLLAVGVPVALDGQLLASLDVVVSCPAYDQEAELLAEVVAKTGPLLDCFGRELCQLGRREPHPATLAQRNEELEWLFALTESLHSNSNDPRAINHLMGATVERLKCCFGAVVAPEHGIDTTHASLVHIDIHAERVFDRLRPYLFDFMRRKQQTLMANQVPAGTHLSPFKWLLVPIQPRDHRLLGYVVFFKQATRPNFGRSQVFLARQVGHQIGTLLESQYDHATGLLTRGAFEEDIRRLLKGSPAQAPHALLYLNIDHLRAINDTAGFEAGDEAIVAIADLLRAPLLPENAICSRLGGDNFAVFLARCDALRASQIAAQLLARAAALSVGGTRPLPLSLSCGIALLSATPFGVLSELNAAQLACASAKQRGGNRHEIYAEVEHLRLAGEACAAADLRSALSESRFCLYGQKIVAAAGRQELSAVECLLRMLSSEGNLLQPEEFLPVAQRHQLLKAIDQWVIQRTLREAEPHREALLQAGVVLAVNISAQSVSDEMFAEDIVRWVAASGIAAQLLRFEIAESAAQCNMARTERLIRRLRELGAGVALDDFGVAINSLSYLKCLPVSCVKIDASLTRELTIGSRHEVIIQSIAQLARARGIECVAECVESLEAAERLKDLGVGLIQGFVAHKPEPLRNLFLALNPRADLRAPKRTA